MEDQLLIQFPDELCDQIAKGIDSGKLPSINLRPVNPDENEYQREFELRILGNKQLYPTKLMDLPCIIESQKTYNKNLYFKTGDISQMLIVQEPNKNNKNTKNDDPNQYTMDSGITPPSRDIRERWSHVRPICTCDDVDINELCKYCHNIPRGLIEKVSRELYHRMHGQASEEWELIPIEEEIEVDDDDDEVDKKLANIQSLTRDEWEESDDDDQDIRMKMKINHNHNNNNNYNTKQNTKTTSNHRIKENKNNLKRPASVRSNTTTSNKNNIKQKQMVTKSSSMSRQRPSSLSRTTMNRKTTPIISHQSHSRPPSSTRSRTQMRSPSLTMSAQPPPPIISSVRKSTPRNATPLISKTMITTNPNLVKVNTSNNSNNSKKNQLQQKLKEKQSELQEKEAKWKKQANRHIKKKLRRQIEALKKEIAEIESQIKSL